VRATAERTHPSLALSGCPACRARRPRTEQRPRHSSEGRGTPIPRLWASCRHSHRSCLDHKRAHVRGPGSRLRALRLRRLHGPSRTPCPQCVPERQEISAGQRRRSCQGTPTPEHDVAILCRPPRPVEGRRPTRPRRGRQPAHWPRQLCDVIQDSCGQDLPWPPSPQSNQQGARARRVRERQGITGNYGRSGRRRRSSFSRREQASGVYAPLFPKPRARIRFSAPALERRPRSAAWAFFIV
jgi:hypothetical protein